MAKSMPFLQFIKENRAKVIQERKLAKLVKLARLNNK